MIAGALLLPLVMVVGIAVVTQRHRFEYVLSHKALVELYDARRGSPAERLIYVGQRPVSAEFYARGRMVKVPDTASLDPYLDDAIRRFSGVQGA